jgi:uncharacterized protein
MLIIDREITNIIVSKIKPGKVVVINGARRVGKTFLLRKIIKRLTEPHLLLNGEDFNVQEILSKRSAENYRQLMGSKKVLLLDEAQRIPQIGLVLKLMVDEMKGIRIVATGSSAFDLGNITGEPLTGRKSTFTLFPFSEREFAHTETIIERDDRLKMRLVYGNYPELIHLPDNEDKKEYLMELISSYLLKDILIFENIRHSAKIFNLLRLIAYQIGNLVSYNELARQLSMSKNTVERYMDLLSRVFIISRLEGFSRNLRKEITKNSKWYFTDNGVRNAVLANFTNLDLRNDAGQLWENYIISERIKFQQYKRKAINNFFWRTYDQQAIEWIEESEGRLSGFEFKWSGSKIKPPPAWTKSYPEANYSLITPKNYFDWLSG